MRLTGRHSTSIFAIAAVVFIGGACASVTNWLNSPGGLSQGEIPQDLLITYDTDGCWGSCPSFTLSIDAAGEVRFKGRNYTNVNREGEQVTRISKSELAGLVKAFEEAGYFSLEDEYTQDANCPSHISSSPWANTSITYAGKKKAVRHYGGCLADNDKDSYPPGLEDLEQQILETSGVRTYFDSSARADQ